MVHRSESTAAPGTRDGARRLAAIAFTDIVGYSALVNRDDANAMRLVEEHFALVRNLATPFGGKVIKTIGDSVHLEFASGQAATACSIAIQQAHQERNTRVAEAQRFDVRIGVHTGDVEHRGGDIYGDGVNIAARLQPLAPVGGIAISDHVRSQLRLDLRNRFTSRGTPVLKNIETPIELFVLEGDAIAGIEVDAPAPTAPEPAPPHVRSRRPLLLVGTGVVVLLALAVAFVPYLRGKNQAAIPDKSIAVLPFVNLSSDKEQEFFSDGISEDLLNLLTRVQTLQVAARTSSFSFKGKDVAIQDIAVALRVAHVLEGSVRKSGNQVRITAQLVRTADGYQMWSQSWDRQLDDVFKVQDEIAQAVVDELKIQLLGEVPTAKPVDSKAYPLILQAEALMQQFSPESLKRSVAVYEEAVAIAPNEARAWAGLSRGLINLRAFGGGDLMRIRQAADKALALDPKNVIALTTLSALAMDVDGDLAAAARYLDRARAIEPGNHTVLNRLGTTLMNLGRFEEGLAVYAFRAAHDPANAGVLINLGTARYNMKQWDAAIEVFRAALRLSPDAGNAHLMIGQILLVGKKNASAALAEFRLDGDESNRLAGASMAFHDMGRAQESDASLRELIEKFGSDQPEFIAVVYAYRKEADAAFEWLDKALASRDPYLAQVASEMHFASLHRDPRWLAFLRKIGYAPDQLATIQLNANLPATAGGRHEGMSQAQPIRSMAAIVFTDIVGYSALVNRDDANAMRMVEEHFALVRKIATEFGGKVIKTIGDSVHLELASAQAATACSIAIQQAHQERNTRVADAQRFDVRIGVHAGDVEHRGGDIYGDGVNIAARLQPLAPVGGIAISDHVRGQLRLDLRNRFTSRGTPTLKNIETPIELFVLEGDAIAGIELETPPPAAAGPAPPAARSRRRLLLVGAGVVAVALLALAATLVPQLGEKTPVAIPDKSIAVLPFVNLSSDKEQEYFSDGISEDLLNLLTKVQALQVAARTSSFSFKGKDVPIQDIAVTLRVAHLLQGSVRKSGNQVRITAQLVRSADGYQMWSQSWDRQLDDVFKIQDEIALAVVEELKVQLLGAAPTAKPVDPKAYPLILQAESSQSRFSPEGWKQAVALYDQALEVAPNEARAWAGLSSVLAVMTGSGVLPLAEGFPRAQAAANRALELDPTNVVALATLARMAAELNLDLPTAAGYLERARALEPTNPVVLNKVGSMLLYMGRLDDALAVSEFRAKRDPASAAMQSNLGHARYCGRQWEGSIEALRKALRLSPDAGNAHLNIGLGMLLGRKDAAAALVEFRLDGDESNRLAGEALAFHALGRSKEADARVQELVEKFGDDQPEFVATVHAYRGNHDAAFERLDKAFAIKDPFLPTVLTEPLLEPLHEDPRWLPFLRKIGYAPEQLAKIELKVSLPQQAGP